MPNNISEIRVSLGMPEILREGIDITIVTYGSVIKIAEEAAMMLEKIGISCEIIDVQTLLPFDINHSILASIKKKNWVEMRQKSKKSKSSKKNRKLFLRAISPP